MKKVFLFSVLALSITLFGCGNSEEKKQDDGNIPPADTSKGVSAMTGDSLHGATAYVCPCGGCPEVKESKAGKCPKCQMDLVEEKK